MRSRYPKRVRVNPDRWSHGNYQQREGKSMQDSLIRQERSCNAALRKGRTMTRDGGKVCKDDQDWGEL